jgi:Family of unknown function (DUF5947)
MSGHLPHPGGPFAALRRFVAPRAAPLERCELCRQILAPTHPHLLEVKARTVACSCDACALLFTGVTGSRFRRIPRDTMPLPAVRIGEAMWERFGVPIGLAFFVRRSDTEGVAVVYPSPAGPMEGAVAAEAWPELVAQYPILGEMEPDVVALLVNRVGEEQCFLAPIDECYRLVGLIRGLWRGLAGGQEVWGEVARFFARLREGGHA